MKPLTSHSDTRMFLAVSAPHWEDQCDGCETQGIHRNAVAGIYTPGRCDYLSGKVLHLCADCMEQTEANLRAWRRDRAKLEAKAIEDYEAGRRRYHAEVERAMR